MPEAELFASGAVGRVCVLGAWPEGGAGVSELQKFAASLVALVIVFALILPVAVYVFGVGESDAVWLVLVSWALACVWRDVIHPLSR